MSFDLIGLVTQAVDRAKKSADLAIDFEEVAQNLKQNSIVALEINSAVLPKFLQAITKNSQYDKFVNNEHLQGFFKSLLTSVLTVCLALNVKREVKLDSQPPDSDTTYEVLLNAVDYICNQKVGTTQLAEPCAAPLLAQLPTVSDALYAFLGCIELYSGVGDKMIETKLLVKQIADESQNPFLKQWATAYLAKQNKAPPQKPATLKAIPLPAGNDRVVTLRIFIIKDDKK